MAEDRMLSDEELLALIKKNSGGGGTTNYNQLENKPQIGGVTLSGDKSASDLGLASLDSNGKVPAAQLPSYVDDVVNGYLHDGKFYADDQYTTEITGEDGKIYVDLATNKTYRWSGLAFVEISESLALGETPSTAYAGDKGKANADAINAITNGESINNFAGVETALATKQTASDNSLETDAKTIVGAINEHEGDIATLKSGFTNLDNEVNGDATTYPYADVITIPDAVPANLADCTVKIEPVQDLHGFDNPWVGGAGKNKLPMTVDGIKALNSGLTWNGNTAIKGGVPFTILTDSDNNVLGIKALGTSTAQIWYFNVAHITTTETLLFNTGNTYSWDANKIVCEITDGTHTYHASTLNGVEVPAGTYDVAIAAQNNATVDVTFLPMLRATTETDATFAPYTNICPISGHTEASVQRDGKNLFDKNNTTSGYINGNNGEASGSSPNWEKSEKIYVHPNTQYIISVDSTMSSSIAGLAFYDKDNNYISGIVYSSVGWMLENSRYYQTLTSPSNAVYVKLTCGLNDENRLMFARGTVTAYTPYVAPHIYTLALGDTIYGGTVDFNTGLMTVTHKYVDLGDYNFYKSGNNWYSQDITDFKRQSTGTTQRALFCICDKYPYNGKNGEAQIQLYYNTDYSGYRCFIFDDHNADNMNGTQFHTYITGTHICYELNDASTFTIQLTPQQIQLLKGTNTLAASTGQISVTANGVSGAIGAVQEQVNELAEEVAEIKPLNYSTTEQNTGQKWIDDKDIYARTWDFGEDISISSTTWTNLSIESAGFAAIVKTEGMSDEGGSRVLNSSISEQYVRVLAARDGESFGLRYITLYYTKTT